MTGLSLHDLRLLRLLSGRYFHEVRAWAEDRSRFLIGWDGGDAPLARRSEIASLLQLGLALIRGLLISHEEEADAIVHTWDPGNPGRVRGVAGLLDLYHPGISASFIEGTDGFFGRHPRPIAAITLIVRSMFLSLSPWSAPSFVRRHHVRALRLCLLLESRAASLHARDVYLCTPNRHISFLAAAYLSGRGHRVTWMLPIPVSLHSKRILARRVIVSNWYQYNDLIATRSQGIWDEAEVWGSSDQPVLVDKYVNRCPRSSIPTHTVVGVYMQGFWIRARAKPNRQELRSLASEERELIRLMNRIAGKRANTEFIFYPHPIERDEELRSIDSPYVALAVENARVEMEHSAIESFNEIDLGITMFSTIGFDRLSWGFPTLFYMKNPHWLEPDAAGSFSELFVDDEVGLELKLNRCLEMSEQEFVFRHLRRANFTDSDSPGYPDQLRFLRTQDSAGSELTETWGTPTTTRAQTRSGASTRPR